MQYLRNVYLREAGSSLDPALSGYTGDVVRLSSDDVTELTSAATAGEAVSILQTMAFGLQESSEVKLEPYLSRPPEIVRPDGIIDVQSAVKTGFSDQWRMRKLSKQVAELEALRSRYSSVVMEQQQ